MFQKFIQKKLILKTNSNITYLDSTVIGVSIFSTATIYIRNFIEFKNPIYPLDFLIFEGKISVSELQSIIFSPRWLPSGWSSFGPISYVQSNIMSPIEILFYWLRARKDLEMPELRLDIYGFAFDSPYGGTGFLGVISLLTVVSCLLYGIYVRRIKSIFKLQSVLVILFGLIFWFTTPGAWMPRWGLGGGMAIFIGALLLFQTILSYHYQNKPSVVRSLIFGVLISGTITQVVISLQTNYRTYQNPILGLHMFDIEKRFLPVGFAPNNLILKDKLKSCPPINILLPAVDFISVAYTFPRCREHNYFNEKDFHKQYFQAKPGEIFILNNNIKSEIENVSLNEVKLMPPYWDKDRNYLPRVFYK
jgi:hypothetical protein